MRVQRSGSAVGDSSTRFLRIKNLLQAISKMQITFKDKARADEEAQHTWEYVSILKRLATP
jgi:hypothetical protein